MYSYSTWSNLSTAFLYISAVANFNYFQQQLLSS